MCFKGQNTLKFSKMCKSTILQERFNVTCVTDTENN